MKSKQEKFLLVRPPKGTRGDLFEDYLYKIEFLNSILSKIARNHGFSRIDLPIFEYIDIFELTSQFNREKCYFFQDKVGRELVLRPDINAPITRAIINNLQSSPVPIKLFFTGEIFRYRHSRKRDFRIFGFETYGLNDSIADAEILSIVAKMIEMVGFPGYEIEFSNLNIYYRFIEEINKKYSIYLDSQTFLHDLRLTKDSKSIHKTLDFYCLPFEIKAILLRILLGSQNGENDIDILKEVSHYSAVLEEELGKTMVFIDRLAEFDLENVKFHINNLHGMGFYSGLTYRIKPLNYEKDLADGGRYDHMAECLGGKPLPATGLGVALERFVQFIEDYGISLPNSPVNNGMIVIFNNSDLAKKFRPIMNQIRHKGIVVEEEFCNRKYSKTINYAKFKGYKNVIFISSPISYPEGIEFNIIHLSADKEKENVIAENLEKAINILSNL